MERLWSVRPEPLRVLVVRWSRCGLAPMGLVWSHWLGRWGATLDPDSPASPGEQATYLQSWEHCADDNDGCLDPIGQSAATASTADRSRATVGPPTVEGPSLRRCDDWFGIRVSFVVCEAGRLAKAAQQSRLGKAGVVRAGARSRAVVTARRSQPKPLQSFDSAPGIAQTVGPPLRNGDVIALRVPTTRRTVIQVHVVHRGRLAGLRWKGVTLRGNTRLRVIAKGHLLFLKDLRTGKRVRPAAIQEPVATD